MAVKFKTQLNLNREKQQQITGDTFTFSGTTFFKNPISYLTDVSSSYGIRSLVDKNFVTGTTYLTANNGLTKSGNNVHWGGALTGATTISGTTFPITLQTTGSFTVGNIASTTTQMTYTPSSGLLKLQGQSISLSGDAGIAQAIRGATSLSTAAGNTTLTFGYGSQVQTAGTNYVYRFQSGSMAPTSGNATINTLTVEPTIFPRGTQSGGTFNIVNIAPAYTFTGRTNTVVGLLYAPTLTTMTGVAHTAIKTNSGDIWVNSGDKLKVGKFTTGIGVSATIVTTGETRSLGGFGLNSPVNNNNNQTGLYAVSSLPTIIHNNGQLATFNYVGGASTGGDIIKVLTLFNPATGTSSTISSGLNINTGIGATGGAITFKGIQITGQINIPTGSTWSGNVIGIDYNPLLGRTNGATLYGIVSRPAAALNGFGGGATLPTATLQVNGNGSTTTFKTIGAGTTTNYSVRNFQSDGTTEIHSLQDSGLFAFSPKTQGSSIAGSWTATASGQSNVIFGGTFNGVAGGSSLNIHGVLVNNSVLQGSGAAGQTSNSVTIAPQLISGAIGNALLINPISMTGTLVNNLLNVQYKNSSKLIVSSGGALTVSGTGGTSFQNGNITLSGGGSLIVTSAGTSELQLSNVAGGGKNYHFQSDTSGNFILNSGSQILKITNANRFLLGSVSSVPSSVPTAQLHVATTGSTAVQRLETKATSNTNPNKTTYQNKVLTTSSGATTLHTLAIATGTTTQIKGYVTARRTGGSSGTAQDGAGFEFSGVYSNTGNTATIGSTVTVIGRNQSTWNVSLIPSASNLLVQVAGANNNNISWGMTMEVFTMSS